MTQDDEHQQLILRFRGDDVNTINYWRGITGPSHANITYAAICRAEVVEFPCGWALLLASEEDANVLSHYTVWGTAAIEAALARARPALLDEPAGLKKEALRPKLRGMARVALARTEDEAAYNEAHAAGYAEGRRDALRAMLPVLACVSGHADGTRSVVNKRSAVEEWNHLPPEAREEIHTLLVTEHKGS